MHFRFIAMAVSLVALSISLIIFNCMCHPSLPIYKSKAEIAIPVIHDHPRPPQEQRKYLSWMKDPNWSRVYRNKGADRDKRYGVSSVTPVFSNEHLNWTGKRRMSKAEMESIVRRVFKTLPHIRTTDTAVALMVETIITESYGGTDIYNQYGDCGLTQMKVRCSKETLKWVKENYPDIYKALIALRNKELNEKDNLIQNVPYNVAMGITHYWRMVGANFYDYIQTQEDRAILWKSRYNTHKGLGTVAAYLQRVNNYKDPAHKQIAMK